MTKWGSFLSCFFLSSILIQAAAFAKSATTQWGADESLLNRKSHVVNLKGNAHLNREDEQLFADEIHYNIDTEFVTATGRVRYQYGDYYVRADAIEIDITRKTGVIYNGNITNGQFALRGSKIEQLQKDRFFVKDYDYTTCLDCPNAWEMTGRNADVTMDGYAYIRDFIFKIKDASFFWLPYMVVPVKTRRQSGLLFPTFGVDEIRGVHYVQPYFWATNDSSDMTFGLGDFAKKGGHFEWEGRYSLTKRSEGYANFYWTKDTQVQKLSYREAGKIAITQELPWGFESKLKVNEVSDSGYPITYSDDITGRLSPVLTSDFFIARNDPNISSIISFKRIRNLLYFDGNNNFISGFDGNTVQEFPKIVVTSNDQFIFGSKLAAGVEARFNSFSRGAGAFDFFPSTTGGVGARSAIASDHCADGNELCTIREANRFTLVPNVYTTWSPVPWLSVVPSLQYKTYIYNFNNAYSNDSYNNLARSYLLGQAEMSVQLEKGIATNDPNVSYRHTIRPTLTYSVIPIVQQPGYHPFLHGQDTTQNIARPGQYFDNEDVVPLGTSPNIESYFTPLGNSLTYGFVSQLFRREKNEKGEVTVARRLEVDANQTFDIREAQKNFANPSDDKRVILSPAKLTTIYENSGLTATANYTYYPYLEHYSDPSKLPVDRISPHRFNTSVNWIWEKGIREGVLWFQRSLGFNYSFSKLDSEVSSLSADFRYSINDYIMPEISYALDLVSRPVQVLQSKYAVVFQSPSRCWRLDAGLTRSIDQGYGFVFDFALNLTGSSFTGGNH